MSRVTEKKDYKDSVKSTYEMIIPMQQICSEKQHPPSFHGSKRHSFSDEKPLLVTGPR